jgi:hypothetical protein
MGQQTFRHRKDSSAGFLQILGQLSVKRPVKVEIRFTWQSCGLGRDGV